MRKPATSKSLTVCLFCFVVTLPLFLSGCGKNEPPPTFNITGSWYTYQTTASTSGEQGPNLLAFTQTDNSISGTASQGQSITGDTSGLNITFSWIGSNGATNTFAGTVSADGATMSGTWTSSSGQSGTWNAIINLPPTVNVTGNWNIYQTTTGTSGEQGPNLFAFTQTGNSISGATSQGQQIMGNISSLDIMFSWTGSDGATNTLTGAVGIDGTTMSGTWTSSSGQSGTWRATKNS